MPYTTSFPNPKCLISILGSVIFFFEFEIVYYGIKFPFCFHWEIKCKWLRVNLCSANKKTRVVRLYGNAETKSRSILKWRHLTDLEWVAGSAPMTFLVKFPTKGGGGGCKPCDPPPKSANDQSHCCCHVRHIVRVSSWPNLACSQSNFIFTH